MTFQKTSLLIFPSYVYSQVFCCFCELLPIRAEVKWHLRFFCRCYWHSRCRTAWWHISSFTVPRPVWKTGRSESKRKDGKCHYFWQIITSC